MKKLISGLFVLTVLFSQTAFAGKKISIEERQAIHKMCRAELKAAGTDLTDKEEAKALIKECAREKIKAKRK